MKKLNYTNQFTAIIIFLLLFVVLPSQIFTGLLRIDIKNSFLIISLGLVLFFMLKRFRYMYDKNINVKIFIFILTLSWIATIVSNSLSQLLLGLTMVFFIFMSNVVVVNGYIQRSVNFAFYFTLFMLLGAWIGVFYTLIGGEPLLCFDNPDGRANCLYLTTFSNTQEVDFWGLLRPSGIFDEPGALSFFTVLVVCLNELYGKDKNRSLILLFLGIITTSLAHVFCILAYLFVFRNRMLYFILFPAILISALGGFISEDSVLYRNFFQRFEVKEDGTLSGDNRSAQVIDFFSTINSDISRYGNTVISKNIGRNSLDYLDQSSNPFSIWFGYGLIMWIPYAITLIVIFYHIFSRSQPVKITSILLFLLILQRPYIYSLNWGFAIWIVITVMFYYYKITKIRN